MKAAVYCHLSTEYQEKEDASRDSQRDTCLEKAEECGCEVS